MRSLCFIAALIGAVPSIAMATPKAVFIEQMQSFWGADVEESDITIVEGEINSDSDDDYVGWRIEHQTFQLIAVVKSEKHNVQIANIRIPIGQGGVCTREPKVSLEAWSEDARTEHGLRHVGPNAIRIVAGDCEPIYLFWPDNVSHAAVDLRIPHK